MTKSIDVNEALENAELLAEKLIEMHGFDHNDFEHDLFYGNPDRALTDIFLELKERGLTISHKEFDEAFLWIRRLEGPVLAEHYRNKVKSIAV